MNQTKLPFYILNDQMQPEAVDASEYIEWVQKYDCIILDENVGDVLVSTSFLGQPDNQGKLFSTMVCGGVYDGMIRRHRSFRDAMKEHTHVVELIHTRCLMINRLVVFWAVLSMFATSGFFYFMYSR